MLEDRDRRNKLRSVINKATSDKIITREEAGFVVTLAEKFRSEIDRKIKHLHMLQGEIAQLQSNEMIIIQLVESMVGAAVRDKARKETLAKLKEGRENEKKRRAETKERLQTEKAEKAK